MAQHKGFQILVLICLIPTSVMGQTTITTPPKNVAQYVGDNVELPCGINPSDAELEWFECITKAQGCTLMFRDGITPPGGKHPSYYSVVDKTSSSGKRFDLVITGVSTTDGGQFRCQNTVTGDAAYGEVIVLGSDMDCSNNLTAGSEVELGDFIYLSSVVTFHGRWSPVARFRYPNSTVLTGRVNETSGNTAKYSVVLAAVKGLQGQTLSAEWYFDDVTGTATGEATNTPTFPELNTCSYPPITVYYPPEGLTIAPEKDSYPVGETITCTAQSNPVPAIEWINMNDSSVTVDCPTGGSCQLVVSQDLLGTNATYRCQPCNNYFSRDRCISQDVTFTTYVTTTVPPTTTTTTTTTTEVTSTSDPNMAGEWEQNIPDADSTSVERDVTSPSYQNIATYVNVSGGARGAGGAAPVTQPESDPYANASGEAGEAVGTTPVTQPGSEPYAELGPIRDPPRRAEYDVLRLSAASDLDHDGTHNYING